MTKIEKSKRWVLLQHHIETNRNYWNLFPKSYWGRRKSHTGFIELAHCALEPFWKAGYWQFLNNTWLTWGIACTFPFPEFYNLYIGERKCHSHCGECTQKGERKIRLFRKPTKESENAIFHHNRRWLLHVSENKAKRYANQMRSNSINALASMLLLIFIAFIAGKS